MKYPNHFTRKLHAFLFSVKIPDFLDINVHINHLIINDISNYVKKNRNLVA